MVLERLDVLRELLARHVAIEPGDDPQANLLAAVEHLRETLGSDSRADLVADIAEARAGDEVEDIEVLDVFEAQRVLDVWLAVEEEAGVLVDLRRGGLEGLRHGLGR